MHCEQHGRWPLERYLKPMQKMISPSSGFLSLKAGSRGGQRQPFGVFFFFIED